MVVLLLRTMKHPPTPECNRFTHSRIDTTLLQSPTLSPTHLLIHAFTRSLVHSCTRAPRRPKARRSCSSSRRRSGRSTRSPRTTPASCGTYSSSRRDESVRGGYSLGSVVLHLVSSRYLNSLRVSPCLPVSGSLCLSVDLYSAPPGFDSILARGTVEPQGPDAELDMDGLSVAIPQGKSGATGVASSFHHNEFLVYNESQHRIRYVLVFDEEDGDDDDY